MINEELKVEEMSAEEIVEMINQRKAEIVIKEQELKQAKKEEEKAKIKNDKAYRRYNKIPWPSDVALLSGLGGGVATVVGGFISKFIRDGSNVRRIDDVREYYMNHPDAFEYAKEFTGLTDLDAISGYALGTDSAANALFTGSGLQDFFWNNTVAALGDAAIIAAALIGVPIIATCLLGKYYDKKSDKTRDAESKARHNRDYIEREYRALNKEVEELEEAVEAKKVGAFNQETVSRTL